MYLSLAGSPAGIQQKTEFREEGWAAVSWFPFYIQQSFTGDLANMDHCGTCDHEKVKKDETTPVSKETPSSK